MQLLCRPRRAPQATRSDGPERPNDVFEPGSGARPSDRSSQNPSQKLQLGPVYKGSGQPTAYREAAGRNLHQPMPTKPPDRCSPFSRPSDSATLASLHQPFCWRTSGHPKLWSRASAFGHVPWIRDRAPGVWEIAVSTVAGTPRLVTTGRYPGPTVVGTVTLRRFPS